MYLLIYEYFIFLNFLEIYFKVIERIFKVIDRGIYLIKICTYYFIFRIFFYLDGEVFYRGVFRYRNDFF